MNDVEIGSAERFRVLTGVRESIVSYRSAAARAGVAQTAGRLKRAQNHQACVDRQSPEHRWKPKKKKSKKKMAWIGLIPIQARNTLALLMAALVTVLVLLDLLVIGGAAGLFRALMGAGSAARGSVAGGVPGLLRHGE
jgi:hypothetical protein